MGRVKISVFLGMYILFPKETHLFALFFRTVDFYDGSPNSILSANIVVIVMARVRISIFLGMYIFSKEIHLFSLLVLEHNISVTVVPTAITGAGVLVFVVDRS